MPLKDNLIMAIDVFNFFFYLFQLFVYIRRTGDVRSFGDSILDLNATHLDVVLYFMQTPKQVVAPSQAQVYVYSSRTKRQLVEFIAVFSRRRGWG